LLEHIQTDVGRQLNSSICPKRDVKHCSELSISYLRTHQAWERDEANAANAKQNNCEKCYYIDIFYFLEAALLGNFRVTFIRLPYYMRRLGGLRAHAANFLSTEALEEDKALYFALHTTDPSSIFLLFSPGD